MGDLIRKIRDLSHKVWTMWREREYIKRMLSQFHEITRGVGRLEKKIEKVIDHDGELKRGIKIRDKTGKVLIDSEKKTIGDYGISGKTQTQITDIYVWEGVASKDINDSKRLQITGDTTDWKDNLFNGAKVEFWMTAGPPPAQFLGESNVVDTVYDGSYWYLVCENIVPENTDYAKVKIVGLIASIIIVDPAGDSYLEINEKLVGRIAYKKLDKNWVVIGDKELSGKGSCAIKIGNEYNPADQPPVGISIRSRDLGMEINSEGLTILDLQSSGTSVFTFDSGGWKINNNYFLQSDINIAVGCKVDSVDISEIVENIINEGRDKEYSTGSSVLTEITRFKFRKGEHKTLYLSYEAMDNTIGTGSQVVIEVTDGTNTVSHSNLGLPSSYTEFTDVLDISSLNDGWCEIILKMASNNPATAYLRRLSIAIKRT